MRDFVKNKMITVILFVFILLSSFLVASGSSMITELTHSLTYLFTQSNVPHVVQLHNGPIDESSIHRWASHNPLVQKKQIVEMLNIDGSHVYLGKTKITEKNSVMNLRFVTQNPSFDFLLDLKGEIIHLSRGEIAVPIYYMQKNNLKIGDKVKIMSGSFVKEFTIVDFLRDVIMNPSIIHSKRFLINQEDFKSIKGQAESLNYLIEFQLSNLNKLSQFTNKYQSSTMPKSGPLIDYQLFKILNSVTDGIIIGTILLVSILLTIVAILCLRFAILSTIEEDYKQIGILKAIGIPQATIKGLYLIKYLCIAGLASATGYLASLFFKQFFMTNIMLYLGSAPTNILHYMIPFLSVCILFLLVMSACMLVLRKFNTITAVAALREGIVERPQKNKPYLSLHKNNYLNINFFLGIRDVFQRFRMFILLFFVFLICSFTMIVPLNFLNTIRSPSFITYLGIGRSEVRIDLNQSTETLSEANKLIDYIKNDKAVERYTSLTTARFKHVLPDGSTENINVESGDFSIFPLSYMRGRAPLHNNEIALSYLISKELKKKMGDTLSLIVNGQNKEMLISGIYQDITNGGKSAKALLAPDPNTVLMHVINLDFKPQVSLVNKISEYEKILPSVKLRSLNEYLSQTLGDLIKQLESTTKLTILFSLFMSILITYLFLKVLIAKNYAQIAMMKAIGFTLNNIRIQYLTRCLLVLNLGILLGAILSNTLGQSLVSALSSFMGAAEIKFIINPLQVYIFCPLALMCVVSITAFANIASIKKIDITNMIME